MLFGERPYWWIEESGAFANQKPNVQQFRPTCETGPGKQEHKPALNSFGFPPMTLELVSQAAPQVTPW